MESSKAAGPELERLVGIMARLRAENGCPWDREQDLRSLRPYLVEETYEVLDEMDRVGYGGNWAPFCEELGDLLFQIVFHAQLASELNEFTMADVCKAISDKITRRHPHVFGEERVNGATQVLQNWAKLKAEERKQKHGREGSVLDGVPSAAPALMRAERLTEKASRIGFDWPDLKSVRAKVDEELAELDDAITRKNRDELEHELGDVFFALCNLARFIQTPPEDALRQANRRFTQRFHYIEEKLRERGVAFGAATLEEMDALWNEAKKLEKASAGLPRPLHAARVLVQEVTLTVPNWLEQTAFWDELAPVLGWKRTDVHSAARYGDERVAFLFEKGGDRVSPVSWTVAVPSPVAFAAAAKLLSASQRTRELKASAAELSFVDPSGLKWLLKVS